MAGRTGLAEETKLVSEIPAQDEANVEASSVFKPKDLVHLTTVIAAMNAVHPSGCAFQIAAEGAGLIEGLLPGFSGRRPPGGEWANR